MTEFRMIDRCAVLALCAFALAGCPGEPHASNIDPNLPKPPKRVALEGEAGEVQEAVEQFYDAWNDHSYADADQFTTEDWNFLDAFGGWIEGRDDVIHELDAAHEGALAKTTHTLEQVSINFATSDVAVVTATSRVTPFKAPDGLEHGTEDRIVTFVVVKRDERWLVMQTQNTIMFGLPDFSRNSAGDIPADLSGDTESEEARMEQIDDVVSWFTSLTKSHDFDAAPKFAAADLNTITPIGAWSRSRTEAFASLKVAFTTFLDGVAFTPQHKTVRFATDDVAVVTITDAKGPFTDNGGVDHKGDSAQNTFVVANRDGNWRLVHWQATPF